MPATDTTPQTLDATGSVAGGDGIWRSNDLLGLTGYSGGDAALNWSSDDFQDGGIVTLATDGTYNFGTKSNAKPLYAIDFEDGTANPVAEWSVKPTIAGVNGESTTAVLAPNATKSWRFDHSVSSAAAGPNFDDVDLADRCFAYIQRYYDFDITDPATHGATGFNIKHFRRWPPGITYIDLVYGYEGSEEPGGNARLDGENSATPTQWFPSAVWSHAQWLVDQFIDTPGTLDVADAWVKWKRGSSVFIDKTDYSLLTTTYPNKRTLLFLDQVSNGTSVGAKYTYYNFVYIDNTPKRVVVADTNDITTATISEPCIATSWSSNSITFVLRQGIHLSLPGNYLIVIDDDDTQIAAVAL